VLKSRFKANDCVVAIGCVTKAESTIFRGDLFQAFKDLYLGLFSQLETDWSFSVSGTNPILFLRNCDFAL